MHLVVLSKTIFESLGFESSEDEVITTNSALNVLNFSHKLIPKNLVKDVFGVDCDCDVIVYHSIAENMFRDDTPCKSISARIFLMTVAPDFISSTSVKFPEYVKSANRECIYGDKKAIEDAFIALVKRINE